MHQSDRNREKRLHSGCCGAVDPQHMNHCQAQHAHSGHVTCGIISARKMRFSQSPHPTSACPKSSMSAKRMCGFVVAASLQTTPPRRQSNVAEDIIPVN
eukprot:m.138506 g.138506  ORF g.138506 m.138506 type:complete len:99 (-) comp14002_c0_seq2:40-336(-)